MKFSKFVKSLALDGGAIYEYMDKRWLASPSVLMLIPDGIRSVTGYSNEKMPDGIGRLISQVGCTEYATLVKAIMPEPDGAIKDCVRIFATQDSTMTLPITNDDWSLIEKSDFCEILYAYDLESDNRWQEPDIFWQILHSSEHMPGCHHPDRRILPES